MAFSLQSLRTVNAAGLAAASAGLALLSTVTAAQTLIVRAGTVYTSPDSPPVHHATVLIERGRITSVGGSTHAAEKGAALVDCPTCTVTAGFWNVHVHFSESKWSGAATQPAAQLQTGLDDMLLSRGFTTVADLASNPLDSIPLRDRVNSGEIKGPHIYTAGAPLFPPAPGLPFYISDLPKSILDRMYQPSTLAEAREDVGKNFDQGSDLLKLFTGSIVSVHPYSVKPMPLDIARAAVDIAHQRHKLAFAHTTNLEGTKIALESGVDVLAHAPSDPHGVDHAFLKSIVDRHVAMVPTLKMFSTTVTPKDEFMLPIVDEVRTFHALGGQLLFGTDVGYMKDYSTDEEFRRLSQAGLQATDILRMVTLAPAQRFGVAGRTGTIAAGKDGDLTVLEADPAADAVNFARVRCTIRQGKMVWGDCNAKPTVAQR